MVFTKFTKDMNIIQKLDDEPNDVGGLTAAELKAKFDEPANAVKDWINETFVPEVEQALAETVIGQIDPKIIPTEAIGAARIAGDTFAGTVGVSNAMPIMKLTDTSANTGGKLYLSDNNLVLQNENVADDSTNRRMFRLDNSAVAPEIKNALRLVDISGGGDPVTHIVLHTGNKSLIAPADIGAAAAAHSHSTATTGAAGLMSAEDKSKLNGVAAGANKYVHPNSGVSKGTYRKVTVDQAGHVTGGSNPVAAVAEGGTGASDAANALKNLGAAAAVHASRHFAGGGDPITPADIGAVKKTGDTFTGTVGIANASPIFKMGDTSTNTGGKLYLSDNNLVLQNENEADDSTNRRMFRLDNSAAAADIRHALRLVDIVGGGAPTAYTVLHTGNKDLVTPGDIGALSKAGDTMTGALAMVEGSTIGGHTPIHTGNKDLITPGDIGAISEEGGAMTGALALTEGSTIGGHTPLHTGSKPSGNYIGNGGAAAQNIVIGGTGNWCAVCCMGTGAHALVGPRGGIGFFSVAEPGVFVLPEEECRFIDGTLMLNTTGEYITQLVNSDGSKFIYQVL